MRVGGRSTLSRQVVTIVKLQFCEQCFSLACGVPFALPPQKCLLGARFLHSFHTLLQHSVLTTCTSSRVLSERCSPNFSFNQLPTPRSPSRLRGIPVRAYNARTSLNRREGVRIKGFESMRRKNTKFPLPRRNCTLYLGRSFPLPKERKEKDIDR